MITFNILMPFFIFLPHFLGSPRTREGLEGSVERQRNGQAQKVSRFAQGILERGKVEI